MDHDSIVCGDPRITIVVGASINNNGGVIDGSWFGCRHHSPKAPGEWVLPGAVFLQELSFGSSRVT